MVGIPKLCDAPKARHKNGVYGGVKKTSSVAKLPCPPFPLFVLRFCG